MCGVLCGIFSNSNFTIPEYWSDLQHLIQRRGPDKYRQYQINVNDNIIIIEASILHLSGVNEYIQPIVDSTSRPRHIFCFNGEAYNLQKKHQQISDARQLAHRLFSEIDDKHSRGSGSPASAITNKVNQILSQVDGPFAFLYLNIDEGVLTFGRDVLGQRSLLANQELCQSSNKNIHFPLLISSVSAPTTMHEWTELDTKEGFFTIQLSQTLNANQLNICQRHLWLPFKADNSIQSIPHHVFKTSDLEASKNNLLIEDSARFGDIMNDAVNKRVSSIRNLTGSLQPFPQLNDNSSEHIPSVAILFSGGIDSLTLAILVDKHVHPEASIELINVAFENANKPISMHDNAKYSSMTNLNYCVPDRVTALNSLMELQKKSNQRRWKLIQVDVSIEEYKKSKSIIVGLIRPRNTVMDLSIAAALFWAAKGEGIVYDSTARIETVNAYQRCSPEHPFYPYTSQSRVLLSGLGADELLGGYGHHRSAFHQGCSNVSGKELDLLKGWIALENALSVDLDRISVRNLGRDDRIISHHGKEIRYPFLDRRLITFLIELHPVWRKCDLLLPKGKGDKRLLRYYIDHVLGFTESARLHKRAIQFGARTAKIEMPQSRGTDIIDNIYT